MPHRAALAILDKLVIAEPSNPEWPQLAAGMRKRLK